MFIIIGDIITDVRAPRIHVYMVRYKSPNNKRPAIEATAF